MAVTGIANKLQKTEYVPPFLRDNKTNEEYVLPFLRDTAGPTKHTPPFLQGMAPMKEVELSKRGKVDRVLGMIGNNSIVQGLYNLTDDDEETTFSGGMAEGLSFMNPLNEDTSNRKSFSDVLKNVGWVDENPDKLGISDVGRGVVGFLGDVFLDPITYVNPFGAAKQVLKGSGVGTEGIKALKNAEIISDVSELTLGAVGASKYTKLADLTLADAKKVVGSFGGNAGLAPELLEAEAIKYLDRFADHILGIKAASEGKGLYLGLNFSAKANQTGKRSKMLYRELVTSDKLRRIGDTTVAPMYNNLVSKLKLSDLGKKFSAKGKVRGITATEGAMSGFKHYYADELLSGLKMLPLDIEDMRQAAKLEEFWNGLKPDEKVDWLLHYEMGNFDAVNRFVDLKESIAKKAGVSTKDAEKFLEVNPELLSKKVADGVTYSNLTGGSLSMYSPDVISSAPEKMSEYYRLQQARRNRGMGIIASDFEKTLKEVNTMFSDFIEERLANFDEHDRKAITSIFGKPIGSLSEYELMTALRYTDKVNTFSFTEIMNHYYNTNSAYASLRGVTNKHLTESQALSAFFKLNTETKQALINDMYLNRGKVVLDPLTTATERANISRTIKDAFANMSESGQFMSPQTGEMFEGAQAALYERISQLFEGGEYISDFGFIKRELESIAHGARLSVDIAGSYKDEWLDVAKIVADRMEKAANSEVARGLLAQGQADAMRGKYLQHITKDEWKHMAESLLHEDANGRYNPDILGMIKKYNQRRNIESISRQNYVLDDLGRLAKDEFGNYIPKKSQFFEEALHEIYLSRTLGSNRLIFGEDVSNYIKRNFGRELDVIAGQGADSGMKRVIDYAKFDKASRKRAEVVHEMLKEKKRLDSNVVVKTKTEIYDEWLTAMFKENPDARKLYSANMVFQPLTDHQVNFAVTLGLDRDIFQIQSNILEKTNVMSRAQQTEMNHWMLNLFDRFQGLWKLQNTVAQPGFHGQNSVSNVFQSYLGIGSDSYNPSKLKRAYHIIRTRDPKQFVTIGGQKFNYQELSYMAEQTGVISKMFHAYEFKYAEEGLLAKVGVPAAIDPTDAQQFFPYKIGTHIGKTIEGTQRMNMFISALEQGHSVETAAELVKQFLYDYADLTAFERDVMKRVVPFYTYMKKNIPEMLNQMLEQPTVFTGTQRALDNISRMSGSYQTTQERNPWRQNDIQFPFSVGGKDYGIQSVMPYMQLERLTPNKMAGQVTPAIKVPYELSTGKSIYTQMDIGDPIEYFQNQTWYPKFVNLFMKRDPGADRYLYTMGQVLGMPINEMKQYFETVYYR